MVFLAFAFGTWLSVRRAAREGIGSGVVMDLVVWILISSLAGARLTYVLFHLEEFRGRWLDVISPIQSDGSIGIAGLVILGGVLIAIPVSIWFLKRRDIPVAKMLDILSPSLAFGIAIGRIGCFLNGCCFGQPTNLPWGIVFPSSCLAGSVYPGEAIHPTQLYAVVYNAIIGVVLLLRTKFKRYDGELFHLFLILYGIARFIDETLRYYRSGMILFRFGSFDFTLSMAISLGMVVVGIVLITRNAVIHSSARNEA